MIVVNQSATVWVYGYKLHLVVCAKYGMVLAMIITPANTHDGTLLKALVEQCQRNYEWFAPRIFIADRGYDSAPNNRFLHDLGIAPIIHKRTSPEEREGGIHNKDGVPRCLGNVDMQYVRTDEETGHHLYRCPESGCALRNKIHWSRYCDYEVWEDPEQDIRLFGGAIRRGSAEWNEAYKTRWVAEHANSRLKANRTLEGHYFRGLSSVTAHGLLATLARQHLALFRVQNDDKDSMRKTLIQVN